MLQHFISVLSSPFLFLNAQQGAPRGGALQDKSRRILQQIPETSFNLKRKSTILLSLVFPSIAAIAIAKQNQK